MNLQQLNNLQIIITLTESLNLSSHIRLNLIKNTKCWIIIVHQLVVCENKCIYSEILLNASIV